MSILDLLLQQPGSDVNRLAGGRTLLGLPAQAGERDNVRLLLAEGADADMRDALRCAALEHAIEDSHDDVAALLAPITTDVEMQMRKRPRSTLLQELLATWMALVVTNCSSAVVATCTPFWLAGDKATVTR